MTTPSTAPTASPASSLDPDEIEKFAKIADEWWDPRGKFRPLHVFNPTRLTFIRKQVCAHFGRDIHARAPFDGLRLIDIGCGGGLVAEPMARLGAGVTAIDGAQANIRTAAVHADQSGLAIDYRATTVEALIEASEAPFDVVLCLEVVEHVADVRHFLTDCAKLLAPGGIMIMATINRTPKAFALAIVGAEYVLGWLPRGTHAYGKLVKPSEAAAPLRAAGLDVRDPVGVTYNPLMATWSTSTDAGVNYMLVGTRD